MEEKMEKPDWLADLLSDILGWFLLIIIFFALRRVDKNEEKRKKGKNRLKE